LLQFMNAMCAAVPVLAERQALRPGRAGSSMTRPPLFSAQVQER
jgi:hypothetical protein